MAEDAPVSDTPITVSESIVEPTKRSDVKQMVVEQQYIPRLDGTFDPTALADQELARETAEVLVEHYYGYTWQVVAESRQGVVAFSIPDLMGTTLKWVINLRSFPISGDKLIVRFAGELLERMGLRRGPMDPVEYENAKRNMHLFQFGDVKQ